MTLEATLDRVRRCRAAGGGSSSPTGASTSCIRHVRMLRAARAEGDLLVVGVNSDASVARLKVPSARSTPWRPRPRCCAPPAVDCVVGFEEDTPRALVARIAPDVLVKGGDTPAATSSAPISCGRGAGRVVTTAFHAGHSSTATMERIRT